MSDCRKCADFEWCIKHEDCGLFKPKPQTNIDRIRAMDEERLAIWLLYLPTPQGTICPPPFQSIDSDCPTSPCENCWIDWLKQECE